jgi:hypothetical protein
MKDATMATPLLMTCIGSYAACATRRESRAEPKATKPTLRTRLTTLTLVVAASYVMFSGERWLLERPPATTNELVVATCVVDVVFGDARPADACTSAGSGNDKENAP